MYEVILVDLDLECLGVILLADPSAMSNHHGMSNHPLESVDHHGLCFNGKSIDTVDGSEIPFPTTVWMYPKPSQ